VRAHCETGYGRFTESATLRLERCTQFGQAALSLRQWNAEVVSKHSLRAVGQKRAEAARAC